MVALECSRSPRRRRSQRRRRRGGTQWWRCPGTCTPSPRPPSFPCISPLHSLAVSLLSVLLAALRHIPPVLRGHALDAARYTEMLHTAAANVRACAVYVCAARRRDAHADGDESRRVLPAHPRGPLATAVAPLRPRHALPLTWYIAVCPAARDADLLQRAAVLRSDAKSYRRRSVRRARCSRSPLPASPRSPSPPRSPVPRFSFSPRLQYALRARDYERAARLHLACHRRGFSCVWMCACGGGVDVQPEGCLTGAGSRNRSGARRR